MRYLVLALALLLPATGLSQHQHKQSEPKPAALLPGMGDVHHPVSTTNAEAQKYFDQGLAYLYGFNHEEAVRSFKRAGELDPNLAMAYWGVALGLGSNYNLQADAPQLKEAYANLQKAQALAGKASEQDRAYIAALSKRYSSDPAADVQKLAADYKAAMGELVKRYPDDLDAATLYAESMMNLRPWKLWTADGKPAEGTEQLVATLESVLKRDPKHTGANHYYIHAIEASPHPEKGLPSAARLGRLAPAAGHLVHMPSHIYIRTGDYEEAARNNADAIVADRNFFAKSGERGVYPMMYYNHNIHFLASAQAMNGRYADAIKAARELEANVKPHLAAMPMLEMFMPYTTVTLVRFQKWDEILKSPQPDPNLKISSAFSNFARGMAYAGTGQASNAEAELIKLRAVIGSVPEDAPFGNNTARGVLQVPENLLAARVAIAKRDRKTGIELFGKAVEAEDALHYNEPPDWDLPVREWLGGALLASGDNVEAEKVFRAELAKHPRNGRALFGLLESVKRQGKKSDIETVQVEFNEAWKNADTKLSVADWHETQDKSKHAASIDVQRFRFADAQLKTGVRLRYAEQGDTAGHPIIMIHGYTDSSFSFTRILPSLSAKYRVYALDMRGHGGSDQPASGYKLTDFAADVLAFMDSKDLRRATIVGHSMGSFIAQQVAFTAPQRVDRLVLIGSATTARNNTVMGFQNEVNALNDPISPAFVRDFQNSTVYKPVPANFMGRVVEESLKVPAHVWRSVMAGMLAEDHQARLSNITAPTLIIWGDREAIFPRAEQDRLVKALPNAVLKIYPDTGHAPHWEAPEQVALDLEKFVLVKEVKR